MARTRLVSSVASRGALQVACGFRPCSGLLGWRADPSRRFLLSVVGNLFLDVYLPGLGARTRLLARPSATSRLGSFRTAQLHGHDRASSDIENMPQPTAPAQAWSHSTCEPAGFQQPFDAWILPWRSCEGTTSSILNLSSSPRPARNEWTLAYAPNQAANLCSYNRLSPLGAASSRSKQGERSPLPRR
jgi:hypothetical protein